MCSETLITKLFILFCIFFKAKCAAEEVLGCGGFIKSHSNIDFSQIIVKLYTKSGSLKDQTECAPNTGYYFIPLYDKGEYILKIEPPRGWSFEPTEVKIKVDSTFSDLCSQGKDINFNFKGFGITGKVVIFDPQPNKALTGPQGVIVNLYDSANKTLIDTTTSSQGGAFSFTPVQPGKYVLVASHPTWVIDKHTVRVTVQEGNTEINDGELSVFGFNVAGQVVTNDGDPIGKVSFILFGNGKVKNCDTDPVEGFSSKAKPLCHVVSDESGRFVFPAVTTGNYVVIPFYAGVRTRFDVSPGELSFTVAHDSIVLPQTFKVTGFTISGKVMASLKPLIPLIGAKVFLSKKQIAITDQNGAYKSDNVKAKQYMLYAEAENVKFEEVPVKISPSNPELPTITPVSFKVEGKVTSSTKTSLLNRKILVKNLVTNSEDLVEVNKETGNWYTYLVTGKYQLNVIVDDLEKNKGLQFFPIDNKIEVKFEPVKNVNFLQLKATLKGSVNCLKDKDLSTDCKQTQVTLKMVDGMIETKTVNAKDGEYSFEDVLPGQYKILVDTDIFCWESSVIQVVVASENPPKVTPFKQTGFSVTFVSSHDTNVEYYSTNTKNKRMNFQLQKGSTRHCVAESGKYEFEPKGCHKYPKISYSWSTSIRTPIILSSNEHLHKGSVVSSIMVDDLKVRIEGEADNQKPTIFGPISYIRVGQDFKYEFSFFASTEENYLIHPLSETLLFKPTYLKVVGSDDCNDSAANFKGEQGKIFTGSISPALEDVSVNLFGRDKETPVYTVVTQKDGKFKIGPLDAKIPYSITAEKEGYILTRDSNAKDVVFYARKLAEIKVEVIDTERGQPLQGVLLSLSGGNGANNYRKNSMTVEDGKITFTSLSPGEYYLRPTLKEYRFDPSSRMIKVDEGATVQVGLVGRRVAFSAYGIVTSLNGSPFSGILVEALGQNDCSELQEEAISKEDGTWRIRGLEPRCTYHIRIKLNKEKSKIRSMRALPESIPIVVTEDIHNIKLIAIEPILKVDVSVRIFSNKTEHFRTLKLKVCREDMPDSPLYVMRLDEQDPSKLEKLGYLAFLPTMDLDERKYFVQLQSSLSKFNYDYDTPPAYFEANTTFKYIELYFNAKRKQDSSDNVQMSFLPLPLIILVTLAFFNRDNLSIWLNNKIENWSRRSVSNSRNSQGNAAVIVPNDPRVDDIIVEQIESINRKNKKPKTKRI